MASQQINGYAKTARKGSLTYTSRGVGRKFSRGGSLRIDKGSQRIIMRDYILLIIVMRVLLQYRNKIGH